MIRKLTKEDVKITVVAEEEDTRVEGSFDSGDKTLDDELVYEIEQNIALGNVWAWCCVKVTVTWGEFSAFDCLGCCSYENEAEFKADGYYDDMVGVALDKLNENVQKTYDAISSLIV